MLVFLRLTVSISSKTVANYTVKKLVLPFSKTFFSHSGHVLRTFEKAKPIPTHHLGLAGTFQNVGFLQKLKVSGPDLGPSLGPGILDFPGLGSPDSPGPVGS